ncbi:hypothetical protein [Nocardioides montaniterrae]
MHFTRPLVAAAGLIALTATACGGQPHDPSGTSSAPTTTSASSASSSSSASAVAPSTGKLVQGKILSYRLPADVTWYSYSAGPTREHGFESKGHYSWSITYDEVPAGAASEALYRKRMFALLKADYPKTAKVLPDRVVGGHPGFTTEARHDGTYYLFEWDPVVGDVRGALVFETNSPNAKRIIDSVLASVEWK